LAVVIWFLIKAVRSFIAGIKIKDRSLPWWIQNTLVFVVIISVLGVIGMMLSANINKMADVLPAYEKNVESIAHSINELLGIDISEWLEEYSGGINFSTILRSILTSISDLIGDAFLVIIYIVFLMLEESAFPGKLRAIFTTSESKEKSEELIKNLNGTINNYILVKTLMSLLTGILSYVALVIIGIDFAFFWAFLIFLLNYIPTVGSLIATAFPALAAILQTGEITPFFIVLGSVGAIQMIVGNIIEPKFMGNSLNISPLVVLLSLAFWGSIWGVIGMLLCVPLTVIMIKIFALFPRTRTISILLSKSGKVV
jgi:predicted PurR-regulated permease PerM